MTTERTDDSTDATADARPVSGRKTIRASDVGLSLTLSDEAVREFDRIQEETIKAAERDQNFSWR